MVKMQAVQSALAVRRQRSRREEVRKAKQRRESGASVLSMPRPSVVSIDGKVYFDETRDESKRILGHVTMFHVGGVLILIGLMLVITSLMPSYMSATSKERRNDLLGTGSFFVILGGVLTTVSRFMSNHEEKELNQYIRGQLSRANRSAKSIEGVCSTPSRERYGNKRAENGVTPSHPKSDAAGRGSNSPREEAGQRGTGEEGEGNWDDPEDDEIIIRATSTSQEGEGGSEGNPPPGYVVVGVESPVPLSSSTEPVLSRILEEDEVDLDTDAATEPLDSTPESSLTPTSPLETQALLEKRHSARSSSKSSSKSVKLT